MFRDRDVLNLEIELHEAKEPSLETSVAVERFIIQRRESWYVGKVKWEISRYGPKSSNVQTMSRNS